MSGQRRQQRRLRWIRRNQSSAGRQQAQRGKVCSIGIAFEFDDLEQGIADRHAQSAVQDHRAESEYGADIKEHAKAHALLKQRRRNRAYARQQGNHCRSQRDPARAYAVQEVRSPQRQ